MKKGRRNSFYRRGAAFLLSGLLMLDTFCYVPVLAQPVEEEISAEEDIHAPEQVTAEAEAVPEAAEKVSAEEEALTNETPVEEETAEAGDSVPEETVTEDAAVEASDNTTAASDPAANEEEPAGGEITVTEAMSENETENSTSENGSNTVSAGEPESTGYIPVYMPVPETYVPKGEGIKQLRSGILDSSYETPNLTSVKDQGNEGICWAYAAAAVLEQSAIKELGVKPEEIDLDEDQIAATLNNYGENKYTEVHYAEPLNLTSGDSVRKTGPGGNNLFTSFMLASQVSPIYQGKDVSKGYDDREVSLREAKFIALKNNANYIEEIKQAIKDYGAVSLAIDSYDYNNSGGFQTYGYRTESQYDENHAVTLVGWDDSIPAANFSHGGTEDTPNRDGGFKFKNSWGDDQGDKGFQWISYMDGAFLKGLMAVVYKVGEANDFDTVYEYDGSYGLTRVSGYLFSNRFTAGANSENVIRAGFGIYDPGEYTAAVILKDNENNEANWYTKVEKAAVSKNFTATNAGYWSVDFDSPATVQAGQEFAVAIYKANKTEFKLYVDETGDNGGWIYFTVDPNNDHVYGGTMDGTNQLTDLTPRIKAFTRDAAGGSAPERIEFPNLGAEGLQIGATETFRVKARVYPTGATNKTLVWKSDNEAVATVSSTGIVTGVAPGITTITATVKDTEVSASFNVTVDNRLASIRITGVDAGKIYKPTSKQYNVTVSPADATYTGDVTWGSSNTSVVTIDSTGLATGHAAGKAKITAELDGKTAELDVTVFPQAPSPTTAVDAAGNVTITWPAVEGADKYRVFRGGNSSAGTLVKEVTAITGTEEYSVTDIYYAQNEPASGSQKIYYVYVYENNIGYGFGVYANFKPKHTITYDLGEGTNDPDNPAIYREGQTISLKPAVPADDTKYFYYWYTSNENVSKNSITSSDKADLTFHARYERKCYYVEYDPNGGTGSMEKSYFPCGVDSKLRANTFSRDGLSFTGWNTKADGTGDSYGDGESVRNLTMVNQGTVKLYAQWKKSVSSPDISVNIIGDVTYTGKAVTPAVTVTDGGKALTIGKDYQISYSNNVNAGTAIIRMTGNGSYFGTRLINFTIQKAVLQDKTVSATLLYGTGSRVELKDLMEDGAAISVATVSDPDMVLDGVPGLSGNILLYKFVNDREKAGKSAVVMINVTGAANYEDYRIFVTLTVTDCVHAHWELRDVKPGTCTEQGYSGDKWCLDCGFMFEKGQATPIDPDNHSYGEGAVTTKPTPLTEGVMTYICTRCGHIKTEAIPRTEDGNDYTELIEDTKELSGNAAAKIEETTKEDGTKELIVKIGNEEVSKTITDPVTGKETVVTSVWIGGLSDSYTYTGKAIKPELHIYDGVKLLTEKKDYKLSFKNNKNAGTATVTVKFTGNLSSESNRTLSYTIKPAELGTDILARNTATAYNKKVQKPVPAMVWAATGKTVSKKYFDLSYDRTVQEIGEYTATISPKSGGNFSGSTTASINVADGNDSLLSKAKVTFDSKSYAYTGSAIVPGYTLTLGGRTLTEGRDYVRTNIWDNTLPGTATVEFEALAISTNSTPVFGTRRATFKITGKRQLTEAGSNSSFTYTYQDSVAFAKGGAKPSVVVRDGGQKLTEGKDYTLKYTGNKAVTAGQTAQIQVKGKGSYKGTVTLAFAVTEQDLNALSGNILITDQFKPKDKVKTPGITIRDLNGKTLSSKTDFYVKKGPDLTGSSDSGTGTVVIAGKGSYKGEVTATFRYDTSASANIAKMKAGKISDKVYTGTEITLEGSDLANILYPKGTSSGSALEYGKDFVIAGYSGNVKIGTAKVTLRGTGGYAGTKTLKFKIIKKPVNYKGALVSGEWQ